MVKNVSGGNKAKKQKRGGHKKREIIVEADSGQMFGLVIEHRGGNHVTVLCSDNIQRIGRLGGAVRKGPKITAGLYVLVALWEFETEQKNCDVLGIANPPADIRNIFKKINPSQDDDVVEFQEEESKFADLHESTNMIKVNSSSKSKTTNEINFADSDDESNSDEDNTSPKPTDSINTNTNTNTNASAKPKNFLGDVFELDDGKIYDNFNKLGIKDVEEEINFDDI